VASDRLVLDSSFALELVLPTHATWQADALKLFERASSGDLELIIPMIFFAEVAAVLTRKVRSRAIAHDEAEAFLTDIQEVPIALDVSIVSAGGLYVYARQWQCGAYDAIYLELAQRMALPIATRDRGMLTAARAAGVEAFAVVA
jgi:predicted nucleic acid-binding protein